MPDQDAAQPDEATRFSAAPPPADADATRFNDRPPTDTDATRFGAAPPPATAPPPTVPAPPGARNRRLPRRFAGYVLLEEIARGGMGVVYKAHQLGPDGKPLRLVALKMVLGGAEATPAVTQRFWNEARAAAGLNHPGIVPVVEAGEHQGQPFYSMEYVEGGSLAGRVKEGGPLPPREAARLLRQVAEAVQAAHDQGIIHRDIKPANVLLAAQEGGAAARLTDFGLARTREGGGSMTGDKLGTPSYMAPEQAAGQVREVSAATDVYGLGAVLYCLLTGRPPFQSSSPLETMRLVLEQEPVAVRQLNPAVPRDLETVCHKCLQKEPGRRYASARELSEDLGRFLREEPVGARPVGRLERGWRWCQRNPVVAGLLTAVVLLLVTGTTLVTWQWRTAVDALAEVKRARQERALSQVHALTEAAPGAVPALLAELADNRATVLPQLRELWQQGDSKARRMRAALALLPVEPQTVRAELVQWLLQAKDPAEVLLVREELAAHGPALADGLWRTVEDPKTRPAARFRALVALARFDPDGPRWTKAGAAAVDELLSANPLHLGIWVQALRPVRAALLGTLGEVCRGRRHPLTPTPLPWGERGRGEGVAPIVLADWAADRPELLADLLLDADTKQDALLFPVLQRQRQRAVELCHAELDRTAPFDWKDAPLAVARAATDAAAVRQVEAAQGMVAERFAFCQVLPLAQLDAVAAALSKAGYRPVRLRPFAAGQSGVQVAAVWKREGRPWKSVHGLTAKGVRERDVKLREEGYWPVDVAGYLDGKEERYAALWVKGAAQEESRLYVGVPERRHRADGWGLMRTAKLQPATLQVLIAAAGGTRYSSVWRKGGPEGSTFWEDSEKTHASRGLRDGLPVDVCLYPDPWAADNVRGELGAWLTGSPWLGLGWRHRNLLWPHPERRYGGCFVESAAFDHVAVFGLTPEQQLRRGRELAAQGYRPAALAVLSGERRGLSPPADRRDKPGGSLSAAVWHRPVIAEELKERLAKRQAHAAAALLRLGRPERVWPLLRHRPDPRVRSYLIHSLSPLGVDARTLVKRLEEEPEVSARRALLLCLGEFSPEQLPRTERQGLIPMLLRLYRDDPDPGLHGAADWLLRRWGQADKLRALDKTLASRERQRPKGEPGALATGGPRWYVNGQGQTMVLVPGPVEFLMGTPRSEAGREAGLAGKFEQRHWRRIGRSFALAAREVTVEHFLHFRKDHFYNKTYSPTPQHPINAVSWYQAAEYCNWLSKQEGIPEDQWCYLPNEKGTYAEGMRMKPNWLSLTGYRLPTEAEWEYACRAGATTSRYYGETEALLGQYAWYTKTSLDRGLQPAGDRLLPNNLGLFDMLGNILEWCQDDVSRYPDNRYSQSVEDRGIGADHMNIKDRLSRVLRGGSFFSQAADVRSGYRTGIGPEYHNYDFGFRVARTYR